MKFYVTENIYQVFQKIIPTFLGLSLLIVFGMYIADVSHEHRNISNAMCKDKTTIEFRIRLVQDHLEKIALGNKAAKLEAIEYFKRTGVKLTLNQHVGHNTYARDQVKVDYNIEWHQSNDLIVKGYYSNQDTFIACVIAYIPLKTLLDSTRFQMRHLQHNESNNAYKQDILGKEFVVPAKAATSFVEYYYKNLERILGIMSIILLTSVFTLFSFVFGQKKIVKKQILHRSKFRASIGNLNHQIDALKTDLCNEKNVSKALIKSLETRTSILSALLIHDRISLEKCKELLESIFSILQKGSFGPNSKKDLYALMQIGLKLLESLDERPEEKDMNAVLNRVLELYAYELALKEIKVDVQLPSTVKIRGHEGLIYILAALIGRRIFAIPRKGRLNIRAITQNEGVTLIKIIDNGYSLHHPDKGIYSDKIGLYDIFEKMADQTSEVCSLVEIHENEIDADGHNVLTLQLKNDTRVDDNVIYIQRKR